MPFLIQTQTQVFEYKLKPRNKHHIYSTGAHDMDFAVSISVLNIECISEDETSIYELNVQLKQLWDTVLLFRITLPREIPL